MPIYLNAGGEAYTDTEGRNWISDADYVQGGCLSNTGDTQEIGNTENDKLYRTDNYLCNGGSDQLEYEIPVPAVGDYVIKLYFAEINHSNVGARVFDIYVEDSLIKQNFDIFEEVGKNTAVVVTSVSKISDGAVSVRFPKQFDNPKISGIEVYEYQPIQASYAGNDGNPLPPFPFRSVREIATMPPIALVV